MPRRPVSRSAPGGRRSGSAAMQRGSNALLVGGGPAAASRTCVDGQAGGARRGDRAPGTSCSDRPRTAPRPRRARRRRRAGGARCRAVRRLTRTADGRARRDQHDQRRRPATSSMSVAAAPIESRDHADGRAGCASRAGLNGGQLRVKPMSAPLTMVSSGERARATAQDAASGRRQQQAEGTATSPSTGCGERGRSRTGRAGRGRPGRPRRRGRDQGAERAATTRRVLGPAPVRTAHDLAAERLREQHRAATSAPCRPAFGRSPEAATGSTMPWTAATTLRQYRCGSGAASHGNIRPGDQQQ